MYTSEKIKIYLKVNNRRIKIIEKFDIDKKVIKKKLLFY